ncbi:MAG TPA: hypothetical protein VK130_06205 [Steroidobacteraceae bacterium]|nr:hypothetical protein [Steroidobacteraceae bacterium]
MRYRSSLFLIIAGLAGIGAAGAGDIFCNNQGRDCSDRWSPGATLIRTSSAPQPQSAVPAPSSNSTMPMDAGANARLSLDASRTAVQKDVGTARAEQCKQAREKYQKSVEARRVYRLNAAGEREYLTDAEADQARLNARLEVERSCGNSAS